MGAHDRYDIPRLSAKIAHRAVELREIDAFLRGSQEGWRRLRRKVADDYTVMRMRLDTAIWDMEIEAEKGLR